MLSRVIDLLIVVTIILIIVIALILPIMLVKYIEGVNDFRARCVERGGRPLIYSRGPDLCVSEDGRII